MSSAVESFGPASAAAAHPYAHHHHNPFAIAAAAAAAGSAAAAAAAVTPSHHHHHHLPHHQSIKSEHGLEHQFLLNHSPIYNNISASVANSHITNSHLGNGSACDLFLQPPRPPTLSLNTSSSSSSLSPSASSASANILPTPLILSSKTSIPEERPNSPRNRSPRSKATNFQGQDGICSNNNMSSAEFARPHPKQPRFNNNNNNNNVNTTNNNNTTSNNNNNNNSHLNNTSYTSNAIPLHARSIKAPTNLSKGYSHNNNNCLNNNNVLTSDKNSNNGSSKLNSNNSSSHLNKPTSVALPRAKYSNEQSGPVNLVTTNNINLMNHNHNNNNCRTPPSSIPPDVSQLSPSSSEASDSSRKSATSSEMYPQKMPFTAQSLAVTSNAVAAAACAAAYQYNYPHIYASRALYGTSALFPGHHALVHHNTLRPCPTYLSGQHEAFSPYLQATGVYHQAGVPTNAPSASAGLLRTTTSQVLLSNNNNNNNGGIGVVATKPSSPLERNSSYPTSNPKDISNTNGTYLNGKVNTSPAAPESVSGFKVPSGKEGSLKHRILTRPSPSDRDATKRKSPITAAVVRSNSNSSTSNFTKGAFIELANGALRRVEDMRTEDFIQSAEKSAFHQLAESTVVKISPMQSIVVITFSYDKNRSKAEVEVSQEHPFFVYGQGWASCNPDLTFKSFGLKCQQLQVGDICISLISKEQPQSNSQAQDKQQQQQQISANCNNNQQAPSQNLDKSESISFPQNLSRKLPPPLPPPPAPGIAAAPGSTSTAAENAIPLTNVVSNVSNRLASMGAPTYIPNSLTHHPYEEAAAYENSISRHHEFYQPPLHLHHHYHRLLGHTEVTSRLPLPPPPPLPPQSHSAPVQKSRPPSNQSTYYPEPHLSPPSTAAQNSCSTETQQQPVDASLSRKRRWSAPESICDDDETECHPPTAPRLSANVNAYNS